MIQCTTLINKSYEDVKDFIIWPEAENAHIFLSTGLVPQFETARVKDDLYLYDFEIDKHRITFLKDKIYSIDLSFGMDVCAEVIQILINSQDFKFEFFTRDYLKEFCEARDYSSEDADYDDELEFDESSVFDFDDLHSYERVLFKTNDLIIDGSIIPAINLFSCTVMSNHKVKSDSRFIYN